MANEHLDDDERVRRARWNRKIQEMKRKKRKQEQIRRFCMKAGLAIACVIFIVVVFIVGRSVLHEDEGSSVRAEGTIQEQGKVQNTNQDNASQPNNSDGTNIDIEDSDKDTNIEGNPNSNSRSGQYHSQETTDTKSLSGEVASNYGVLIDIDEHTIVASRNSNTRIHPASMTKVLTALVAAEHVTNLDDTFTITTEITDYSYVNDCSNAGFEDGETVSIRDLFYGTILPSGGEAALGLATYVAGSQEAFVELMNDKLEELGLSDSAHFTNCIGIYDDNHYCTVYDMAVILNAAIENEFCREVLSAHTYTTSVTTYHPEGITISNWFLRRIEDKDSGGEVICGKTGYVVESGNCAASYAKGNDSKNYICVTADATSGWRCIYDHVAIYKEFIDQK